jgi:hypothetical protein
MFVDVADAELFALRHGDQTKQTIVGIRRVRAGLWSRAPNPDDARSSVLALTATGKLVVLR